MNITLYQTDRHLRDNSDWNCGDNIWLIQWFAPLGHSHQMRLAVRRLFPNTIVRALYHKGSDKGLRILTLELSNQVQYFFKVNLIRCFPA
ncbi:toxin-activating lysine-acyltransferase [Suttonella indologenes]|uniref:RTX toxin-activating lysine-acyltransferase n=1 Tax=Suttonella indologenes TaxID=13276 RepID=A0A380N360_9GAMM|nr:toxin-activating lysine-acyltransferase [Suttonella indologenes]SUO98543.1 ACP:hemolysin acyltransferase (hemolysin-activating protein) [Suttonella indologenes]